MKEIFIEIREHIKKDFNKLAYLYVFIFTFVSLTLNYLLELNKTLIFKNFGSNRGIFDIIIFYNVVYFAALVPVLIIKKKIRLIKSTEFWVKTLLFIFVFSFLYGYSKLDNIAKFYGSDKYEMYYLAKILSYLKTVFPLFFIMLILKSIFDKNENHLYGLRTKGMNYKPYFIFLLLLLPIVLIASFMPDFLAYYPRFKFWEYPEMFGANKFILTFFYELAYSVNFISTEMFFRGAMVIALAKILDKETVLAMACFYCFSHFGKPVGEAVTSFFGGYILGVIALNHKNINGGIIVHVGLALMMEFVATLQHFIK